MDRFVFVSKAVPKALTFALLALLLSSGQPVMADPSSDRLQERIGREQTQKRAVQERLSEAEKKMEGLKADETLVVQDLERLNRQLHKSRARLREIRAELKEIEGQMETLTLEQASLVAQIKTLEAFAVPRLVAFYKLGQLGVAPVLFSAQTFSQLWQRRESLERILKHDGDLWDTLQDRKRRLDVVSGALEAKRQTQQGLLKTSEEQAARIARQRADRSELLASVQADKDLTLAAIASLKERAKRLDETIKSLQQQRPSAFTGAGPKFFAKLKGSLPRPVQGKILGPFGPYVQKGNYHIKGYRSGVTIQADLDSQVRAVCDGQVLYAGWFKGYGNIMIIDHGEHYYTLSAPLDDVFRHKGEAVLAGEAIGTYGDMVTLSGPGLYFEVRLHGKPLDPALWFKN
ncbi:MAG: peptidoglycan DD-metalloendopeptidase family protein [Thermodesulfobacteriota bacterium]|nr:peptidoglycan DD-metalloendopeptidase family protein [Thermodesulfobacteriota bacterium]